MIYVAREIATVEGTILTYFLVEMWRNRGLFVAGFDPDLVDEFLMQLDAGMLDPDGDPIDLVPTISGNIFARWGRADARGERGDHTADRGKPGTRAGQPTKNNTGELIKRDLSDPKGVLATADVMALLNEPIEVRA